MSAGAFELSPENQTKLQIILSRYPEHPPSALLPVLQLVQEVNQGWVPDRAIPWIATLLGVAPVHVMEVVTFHTLFSLKPPARYTLKICQTTSCWLRGSEALLEVCREKGGLVPGQTSKEGLVALEETHCLGRCCGAPVVQLNDCYWENLTPETFAHLLEGLLTPSPGEQARGERQSRTQAPETMSVMGASWGGEKGGI